MGTHGISHIADVTRKEWTDDADFDITGASGKLEKNNNVSLIGEATDGDEFAEDCDNFIDAPWTEYKTGTGVTEISPAGQFHLYTVGDGNTNRAYRRYDASPEFPGERTAEFEVKFAKLAGGRNSTAFLFNMDDGGTTYATIQFSADGIYVYDGASWNQVDSTDWNDNIWHIIRIVIDGDVGANAVLDIWVDGIKIVSAADCSYGSTGLLQFCAWSGSTDDIEVYIDWLNVDAGLLDAFAGDKPEAICVEKDAGISSVWDMASFASTETGPGSLKYQYSAHNTQGSPSYNGTWLTKSELQAESDPTGRYFQLKVQFISDGTQDATIDDISIIYGTVASDGIPEASLLARGLMPQYTDFLANMPSEAGILPIANLPTKLVKVIDCGWSGNNANNRIIDLGDDYDFIEVFSQEAHNPNDTHPCRATAMRQHYQVNNMHSATRYYHWGMSEGNAYWQGKVFTAGHLDEIKLGSSGADSFGFNRSGWNYRLIGFKFSSME